jgi:uncharacterized SAM-binding protein YcdF (DUF218 family)
MTKNIMDIKDTKKTKKRRTNLLWYIFIALGIAGILDTIVLIPFMPGIDAGLIMPALFGSVLILYSLLRLKKNGPIIGNRKLRKGAYAIFLAGLILFAVVEGLIIYHASKTVSSDEKADFILVLGCGIFPDGSLTQTLQNRLDAALEYYNQHPDAVFVVSGGQGPKEPVPEATAMKNYLMSKGIPEEKILTESKSTSTNENMKFSKQIIEERFGQIDAKTVIATSDFHMFRSKMLAKHYGFTPYGIPGKTPWYIRPNSYLREFLAVIKSVTVDIMAEK